MMGNKIKEIIFGGLAMAKPEGGIAYIEKDGKKIPCNSFGQPIEKEITKEDLIATIKRCRLKELL